MKKVSSANIFPVLMDLNIKIPLIKLNIGVMNITIKKQIGRLVKAMKSKKMPSTEEIPFAGSFPYEIQETIEGIKSCKTK